MIHGIFVVNNHGKARLIKCYDRMTEEEQQRTVREIHGVLSRRPDQVCNFVEGKDRLTFWAQSKKDVKIIYRHYATLYFVFVVDQQESELGILDLVQVFVEALDNYFENVCELDLIFNMDKVHYILDEIVLGGMVLETNILDILDAVREQDQLEKSTRRAAILQ